MLKHSTLYINVFGFFKLIVDYGHSNLIVSST